MLSGICINSLVTESGSEALVFVNMMDTLTSQEEKTDYFLCDSGALNMLIQWGFSQNTPSPQKAAFVQFHTAVGKLKTVGFITHL